MTPYIVTFTLSLSSFCIGSLFDKQKMKNAGKIFWIIGIILPCLLAAMRDDSVGIDTLVYQKPFFLIARNYRDSLWGYIDYIKQYEYLYYFVTWICACITDNAALLYFVNQLLTILPIYFALKLTKRTDKEIVIGMYIYFMYIYCLSFNFARQDIAIAFSILAIAFLENDKIKSAIITTIVAIFFHNSAYIMIFVIGMYFVFKYIKNSKIKVMVSVAILIVALISFNLFENILQNVNATTNNEAIQKYSSYINNSNYSSVVGFDLIMFSFLFVLCIFTILYRKSLITKISNYDFWITISLMSPIGVLFRAKVENSYRMFLYIWYIYAILFVPKMCNKFNKKENNNIMTIIIILMFLCYWLRYGGWANVIPYIFA